MQFPSQLLKHLNPQEVRAVNAPPRVGTELHGYVLVLDSPIRDVEWFTAKVTAEILRVGYKHFSEVVANEGGAVIGSLIAAGYPIVEIATLIAEKKLDPVQLIEGKNTLQIETVEKTKKGKLKLKRKVKGKKVQKIHSAQHKGFRFRNELKRLIAERAKDAVTFKELYLHTRIPLIIPVLDDQGNIQYLSHETFPDMAVADAVLATCAVQPYIARVEYKTPEKALYKFYSCSPKKTIHTEIARERFIKTKRDGTFPSKVVIYGVRNPDNELAGISKKTDYYHKLTQKRSADPPPVDCSLRVRLF